MCSNAPLRAVREAIACRPKGTVAPIACGFSGGIDSSSLLHALFLERRSMPMESRFPLFAFYVDHGLRDAAELACELETVKAFCASRAIPLTVGRVRRGAIEERAKSTGIGIEAAAREYRYAAFAAMAARRGFPKPYTIFLGHNLDDQIESLLLRLFTGAGLAGMAGIDRERYLAPLLLVRPMLSCPRKEIESFANGHSIAWSEDSSNQESEFLRNRVRRELIPLLDRIVPSWKSHAMAGEVRRKAQADALSALANSYVTLEDDTTVVLHSASLASLPDALAVFVLTHACGIVSRRRRFPSRFSECAVARLRSLIGGVGPTPRSATVARGAGILIALRGEQLTILPDGPPKVSGFAIAIERVGDSLRVGKASPAAVYWRLGSGTLAEGTFSFPLVLRSPKPGDSLPIRDGKKSVDSLLAAMGIPAWERASVPVVEDSDGIACVLGSWRGYKDRRRYLEGFVPDSRTRCIVIEPRAAPRRGR
jgi:tRNA(Ile)-lysidine synthase